MHVVVLSPHRDDAAFSCGLLCDALLRAGALLEIVNVCTVSDYAPWLAGSASEPVEEVMRTRETEDEAFADELIQGIYSSGCLAWTNLRWKDAPLRWQVPTENVLATTLIPEAEVAALAQTFSDLQADVVLSPLALGGHVDHRLVRDAAAHTLPQSCLIFYEDLPYAARIPASELAREIRSVLPFACEAWSAPAGPRGLKRRLALCYPSQIAPDVADEMEAYGSARGNMEIYYGTPKALHNLQQALAPSEGSPTIAGTKC